MPASRSQIRQLWALIWKSWIVRRVHYISSFFELLAPILIVCLFGYSFSSSSSITSDPDAGPKNKTNGPIYYKRPEWKIEYDFDEDFSSHFDFQLYYGPDTVTTRRLMSGFRSDQNRSSFKVVSCKNELEIDRYLQSNTGYLNAAGIFFQNIDDKNLIAGRLSYKIKILASTDFIEMTNQLFPLKSNQAPGPEYHNNFYEKFTKYQQYLNREYLRLICELRNINDCEAMFVKKIEFQRIPYPRYSNPMLSELTIFDFCGLILIFSYVVFCPLLVKRIADEKSTKARELLRLIGMSDLMYYVSHFVNNFIIIIVHSLFMTLILMAFFNTSVIVYASPILIYFAILLFGVQLILFSMTITTVFNRPVIATIVTIIVWIAIGTIICVALSPKFGFDKTKKVTDLNSMRRLASMTPVGGMIFFMSQLGEYENFGQSLNFGNIGHTSTVYGSFNALNTILFQLLSIPVYCFLIWYLDNVWPFQTGVPKPVYYLFLPSYWLPEKVDQSSSEYKNWDQIDENVDSRLFEPIQSSGAPVICVKNITKQFSSGFGNTKVAVDNLNLNIYPNGITVLLGHNGAGKSTTMNMITGMFKPSSGNVFVNGFNVATQTKSARQSLSLCPQENIVFVELTVYQHLWLFAMLKGSNPDSIGREIDDVLKLLKLVDKKNEMAISLSGGMKRKLSLGIALIGNTNTLILDEPTSGMDPDARRVIWDLLLSIRRQRTILITTHYMEEADILADRIAIMNMGKLSCSGSPYFLKNALGTGYRLRIAKLPGFKSDSFVKVVQRYIPTAKLMSEVETEVVISLESELHKNALMVKLMELFQNIEKNRGTFKLDSCGLSYSTLEDVFLSVGSDSKWNGLNDDRLENERLELSRANELDSGASLVMTQLFALLLKRFHYTRRYWLMFVFQLIIPGVIILLALLTQNLLLNTFKGKYSAHLSLNSTYALYGSNTKSFYYGADILRKEYESIITNQEKGEIFFSGGDVTKAEVDEKILQSVNNDLGSYIRHYLYGIGVEKSLYRIWINFEQFHSAPLALNAHFRSILRKIVGDSVNIDLSNDPLLMGEQRSNQNYLYIILPWLFTCLIFLPIAFPFLASSYILFAIQENVSKSKLIQMMTKMSPAIFWTANFIFDLACHLIAITILFLIIFLFDEHHVIFGKTANNAGLTLFILMFAFGVSTIPIAYLLSYKFVKPSNGFVFLVVVLFLTGFIMNLFLSILEFAGTFVGAQIMDGVYSLLLSVIRIVPIFSFLFGYQKVYKLSTLSRLCDRFDEEDLIAMCLSPHKLKIMDGCCPNCDPCYKKFDPFAATKYGAGIEVLYMLIGGLICFLAIIIYEVYKIKIISRFAKMFPQSSSANNKYSTMDLSSSEDGDVEAERARIEEAISNNCDRDIFSVLHLRKNFGNLTAVDDLTFGVHHGECFGLLGVNGAGKTTTFSMLTGDLIPSSGNAFISNGQFSLVDDLKEFQSRIGYCPQFDALLSLMTGEETLLLFARLRGIPSRNLHRDVKNLIRMVGLEKHAKKLVGAYSGGNKRKLSIAVALIGNPAVLFLDEPSAGVDPAARRKIWQTLGYLKRNFNCSIILTSHSMEECEALCSRLGIMVNGRFRCLGSTQHLRSRYGQGYSVTISVRKELNENQEYINRIQEEVARAIPSAVMKDFHQGLMHYHITDANERWSNIFSQMVRLNETLQFEDYNVSDTTLEQIFLMFARHQKVDSKT